MGLKNALQNKLGKGRVRIVFRSAFNPVWIPTCRPQDSSELHLAQALEPA